MPRLEIHGLTARLLSLSSADPKLFVVRFNAVVFDRLVQKQPVALVIDILLFGF